MPPAAAAAAAAAEEREGRRVEEAEAEVLEVQRVAEAAAPAEERQERHNVVAAGLPPRARWPQYPRPSQRLPKGSRIGRLVAAGRRAIMVLFVPSGLHLTGASEVRREGLPGTRHERGV